MTDITITKTQLLEIVRIMNNASRDHIYIKKIIVDKDMYTIISFIVYIEVNTAIRILTHISTAGLSLFLYRPGVITNLQQLVITAKFLQLDDKINEILGADKVKKILDKCNAQ